MAGMFSLGLSTGAARKPNRFYLAYGSNLSLERMKSRCPDAVALGTAVIPGYRLLFKKSKTGCYATIEQDANENVPAVVWKLSERSWNCWAKISVIWLVISSMMPSSSPLAFSTSSRWSER